jgi:arsenate reductase
MDMEHAQAVEALGALAQGQRLAAFRLLVQAGPTGMTPGELADQLGASPSSLSFHLKALLYAGLASQEPQGRHLIYRARFDAVRDLTGYLTEHCCGGAACEVPAPAHPSRLTPTYPEDPMDTTPSKLNVLFLCTHNSARSILAEAVLNHMNRGEGPAGGGKMQAFSAGSSPRANQQPNPLALKVLADAGVSVDGLHSKNWDVFAAPGAPQMDLVITVCDNAAGEVCPVWPGQPVTAHWGYPDPSEVQGSEEERLKAFRDTLHAIKRRLDIFMALPIEKLDRMKLQQQARGIATATADALKA